MADTRGPRPASDGLEIASGDIQVVARVAQLLRLLAVNETIDLVSAAEELGVGKSTAHRYLASMENHSLLQRRDRNRYEFGVLLAELGTIALSRLGVTDLAGPVMEEISVRVRHTVVLSVWNGHAPVVARVHEDSSRTAHVSIAVGSRLRPGTAQAMVFWAFRGESFYRFGAKAADATEEELAEVRRTGIAVRVSPSEGVSAVATPVRDPAGQVVATLAVVGISQFVPQDTDSPVARALLAGAETITRRMVNPLESGAD
ncbi:IclR family transcriptional regulator [Phytohabitans flavus]|uniref:IclR family transcriptional regulator n=1 Tax=Phytohabitans flavus TaxID=1076124 RepID=A0A6F8XPE7_9ACTN|nr:helix-turn-helix domain-containing protein [Phytohabitans flavus]BCB75696.1 IclR family transcriptional regulator [Phytohabitans flavus]